MNLRKHLPLLLSAFSVAALSFLALTYSQRAKPTLLRKASPALATANASARPIATAQKSADYILKRVDKIRAESPVILEEPKKFIDLRQKIANAKTSLDSARLELANDTQKIRSTQKKISDLILRHAPAEEIQKASDVLEGEISTAKDAQKNMNSSYTVYMNLFNEAVEKLTASNNKDN